MVDSNIALYDVFTPTTPSKATTCGFLIPLEYSENLMNVFLLEEDTLAFVHLSVHFFHIITWENSTFPPVFIFFLYHYYYYLCVTIIIQV